MHLARLESVNKEAAQVKHSLISKGIFPHQWAFTLLFPFRKIYLSPELLIKRIEAESHHTILEVGPGPGFFSVELARTLTNGRLVLADIQQQMLEYASKRLRRRKLSNVDYYLCNGSEFDFQDASFDRIVLVTVLGEVTNKTQYMKEFFRLLKNGGILSVSEQWGDPDKLSAIELKTLACQAGFCTHTYFGNKNNFTINFIKPVGQTQKNIRL